MDPEELARRVLSGDRRALSRAITLAESSRPDHRARAVQLLSHIETAGRESLRVAVSGPPGVGKSTLIEALGLWLVAQGQTVAVVAVDPTSERTGGSILGDKTRMELLSRSPSAYVRPSPSRTALGGVAARTGEVVALCEAAGYDGILVETVGVGQSETRVAALTDVFLLLVPPGGGDELQGVKRGIMEHADLILVNRADGDRIDAARQTMTDYAASVRMIRRSGDLPPEMPRTLTVSATTGAGLPDIWEKVLAVARWRRETGLWASRRKDGLRAWFEDAVRAGIDERLAAFGSFADVRTSAAEDLSCGAIGPVEATARVLSRLDEMLAHHASETAVGG